jgi:hypothetical protein
MVIMNGGVQDTREEAYSKAVSGNFAEKRDDCFREMLDEIPER